MGRGFALLFALAFLTFAGCAEQGMVDDASGALGERRDFRSAKTAGTTSSWSSFIERYPQSSLREKAQAGLDEARWHETETTNTAAAYFVFAQNYPSHPMTGEAKDRCRRILAQGQGTEEDALNYLRAYPDDADARAVRQGLMALRFAAVSKTSDPDGAFLFVSEYPRTPEAVQLLPSVQEQAYAEAEKTGSRLAYQFFLKRYPTAPQAAQAQAKLGEFVPPEVQRGTPADLKLLPKLRGASAALVRRECQKGLRSRLSASADLYDAEAEELRAHLKELAGSGDSLPRFCAEQALIVPAVARQTTANAVHALAVLMERQQYLNSVLDSPDKIARSAEQTADQAGTMADSSESSELDIEALFGNMTADPKKPDESASKNDREAVRRAQRAAELVKGMSKKDEIAVIAEAANRQADLLVEIIAALEKPKSGAKAAPSDDPSADRPAEGLAQ